MMLRKMARQVARTRDAGETSAPTDDWKPRLLDAIEELNAKYFVTTMGGKTVVVSVETDERLKREKLVFSRRADISLLYANRHFKTGTTQRDYDIWKGLGDAWIEHEGRRTYARMAFIAKGDCPADTFNLWRGFGVTPKPGDWSTVRDHMLTVICSGNQDHFDWLIRWCAYTVQYPDEQAETAIVLRGKKGVGKGMFGQLMMLLFLHHSIQISCSRHLVGNFNAHLANVLFLFADEAFWAGDKAGEGALKRMVTEDRLPIEPKGVDAFEIPNRLKILIAANDDWVVPASEDERRWFVLDVADTRKGDHAYFKRLHKAIGIEAPAFLDHLLGLDLRSFNHREPPHTSALNDQKIISADSLTRFWLDCLRAGEIIGTGTEIVGWPLTIPTQLLHAAYLDHAHAHGDRHPDSDAVMVKNLAQLLPGGKMNPIRPKLSGGARPPSHKFDHLDRCRDAFLHAMRIETYTWPEEEE